MRRRLARWAVQRSQLRLDHLFVCTLANLDDAFVVTLARSRDTQYVLARGNICQNYTARAADAGLSLVIDIDLGIDRCEHDQTRESCTLLFLNPLGSILQFIHPRGHRSGACRWVRPECFHYYPIDI